MVHGRGIISWGAVDLNRPDGRDDELIGFVTTRIIPGKDSEVLFCYHVPFIEDNTLKLLRILTTVAIAGSSIKIGDPFPLNVGVRLGHNKL